jgi:hypothetical protein
MKHDWNSTDKFFNILLDYKNVNEILKIGMLNLFLVLKIHLKFMSLKYAA